MATLRIDAQSDGLNQARQELLSLRKRMTEINVQLERNATAYKTATNAQRANLRVANREFQLQRRRISNSRAQIQTYIAEQNELKRLVREKERLNRSSSLLQKGLQGLGQVFRFYLLDSAFRGIFAVQEFISATGRLAVETETARATLRQFADDVDGTFQRLERESRSLIGIDLTSITQAFTQFRAGGAEAEEAITLIRGFSKSLAELNVVGYETDRFFLQLRQSFAANRIEGDDVKSLIEVMPTFLDRASQSLGINVESWKDLQAAIDASGKTVRQFYVDLARQQDLQSAGADLNTFRAQSELFREEVQRLQRRLGEIFLPTLTSVVSGLRELVSGTNESTDAVERLNIEIEKTSRSGIFQGAPQPGSVAQRSRLSETVEGLRIAREGIAEIERSTGQSITNVRDSLRENIRVLRQTTRTAREAGRRVAGAGVGQQLNLQVEKLQRINKLIRDRHLLAAEVLNIEQEITAEATRQLPRPAPSFDGGDVPFPRGLSFSQLRPETSTTRRSLANIGPPSDALSIIQALGQTLSEEVRSIRLEPIRPTNLALFPEFGDSASLQANLTQGFLNALRQAREIQPAVSPTSPFIAGAPADLSGGISNVRQAFEILRIESRDLLNRLQVDARVASIPVLNFARGLRNLGGVLRQAKQESDGLTAAVDAGRRRFAQQVEAEIFQSQQFSRSAVETGTGLAFDLTDLPRQSIQLGGRAADQRGRVGRQASESLADIQRELSRRIEEIENARELSARERAERITQIQRAAAERREDIEIRAARSIAEIDRQLADARRNVLTSFVDNSIAQIQRLIQAELASRLIQQLSFALPGPLGAVALIGTSLGLTAARAGLQRSSVDDQIQRVNAASRQNNRFILETRYDDGTVRNQNDVRTRVIDEGRTPR